MLSLLRAIYTTGEVYLDGIPTSSINLNDLRTKITIIPQVVRASSVITIFVRFHLAYSQSFLAVLLGGISIFSINMKTLRSLKLCAPLDFIPFKAKTKMLVLVWTPLSSVVEAIYLSGSVKFLLLPVRWSANPSCSSWMKVRNSPSKCISSDIIVCFTLQRPPPLTTRLTLSFSLQFDTN